MALVTPSFLEAWASRNHVGARRPVMVVQVRRGSWRRDYRAWSSPIAAAIPDETAELPWYPIFTETTPWVDVPYVQSCEIASDFDQNGLSVATIRLNNVGMTEAVGPLGDLYHAIDRGVLSPSRGYNPPTRPNDGLTPNAWSDVLTEYANVRVWQGFGQPVRDGGAMPETGGMNGAWVFNGLVDDVDLDSDPAHIVIVARAGMILTDSRVFGWNKSKQLKDPVVFSDTRDADDIQQVGENPAASSVLDASSLADNVIDDDGTERTYWRSIDHTTEANTEWVEISVPAGRYQEITLECDAGMELYVGFDVRALSPTEDALYDGLSVPEGFIATGALVPGANGGWPYIASVSSTLANRQVISLGHSIVCGFNSIIRVGFRKLKLVSAGAYRARVRTFTGQRRKRMEAAITNKWILVDDMSDVVRVVLRWAGYQEWEVENTGVRVKGKMLFNRATFLIDIIKRCQELTGFVFFVTDPVDGESQGVPIFRRNAALQQGVPVTEVRDTDFLVGLKFKRSGAPLPYIIRYRGKTARSGSILGGDSSKRIMYVYRPPWTEDNTMAGIIKHVARTEHSLRTLLECQVACYLLAINAALRAYTATIEIAANPSIELDEQVGIRDTSTGLNTRLWTVGRTTTFQAGKQASWTMTIQGSLIDTEDLTALIDEIDAIDFSPLPSPTSQSPSRNTPLRFL